MKTAKQLALLVAAAGLATSFSAYADEGNVDLNRLAQSRPSISTEAQKSDSVKPVETPAPSEQGDEIAKIGLLRWFV